MFCSFTLLVEAQIDFMYSFKVETSFKKSPLVLCKENGLFRPLFCDFGD